jgi:hypothetical protein
LPEYACAREGRGKNSECARREREREIGVLEGMEEESE